MCWLCRCFLHGTKQVVAAASTYTTTNSIYSGRGAAPDLRWTLTVLWEKHTGIQQHASPAALCVTFWAVDTSGLVFSKCQSRKSFINARKYWNWLNLGPSMWQSGKIRWVSTIGWILENSYIHSFIFSNLVILLTVMAEPKSTPGTI